MIWGIYHTKLYCPSNISQTWSYVLSPRISFYAKKEKKDGQKQWENGQGLSVRALKTRPSCSVLALARDYSKKYH